MNKLETGMYVRTKQGKISKIINNDYLQSTIFRQTNEEIDEPYKVLKSSHTIIDLIEVGDYVNGKKIVDVGCLINGPRKGTKVIDYYITPSAVSYLENEDIKSVITHEQIEQMAYKVGE